MIRPELRSSNEAGISDEAFYRAALAAVKKRRGLIHGKFKNGGVCALGALDTMCLRTGITLSFKTETGEELQDVNDSVPKVTKAKRRIKVIKWLEKKLASFAVNGNG